MLQGRGVEPVSSCAASCASDRHDALGVVDMVMGGDTHPVQLSLDGVEGNGGDGGRD